MIFVARQTCVSDFHPVFIWSSRGFDVALHVALHVELRINVDEYVSNTLFPLVRTAGVTLSLKCSNMQLDIFLDLVDPQCAKAWPTLKSAVRDNESTMEFVFHAIPFSATPVAIDFAKVYPLFVTRRAVCALGPRGVCTLRIGPHRCRRLSIAK